MQKVTLFIYYMSLSLYIKDINKLTLMKHLEIHF